MRRILVNRSAPRHTVGTAMNYLPYFLGAILYACALYAFLFLVMSL